MSISSIKSSQSAQYARAARNTSASRSTGNSSAAQSAAARASRNTGSSSYNTRANQTVSQPNTSSANRDSFTSGSYVGSSKKTSQSASKTSASTKRDGFISGNSGANTNQVKKTSTNTNRSDFVNISKSKYEPKKEKQEIEAVNSILDKSIISKTIGALIGYLKDNTTYLPSDNKDDVIVRGLVFKSQEKSNWCWAATTQALLFSKGVNKTQSDIVHMVTKSDENKAQKLETVCNLLNKNTDFNFNVGKLNRDEIISKIDAGEIIVFSGEDIIDKGDSNLIRSPHMVTCYGYNNTDSDHFQLYVFDSAVGRGKVTFEYDPTEKSNTYNFSYESNGKERNHKYRVFWCMYGENTDENK